MKMITQKIFAEIAYHEAVVRESYKDSEDVWSWGIGVTDTSGHDVAQYRRNPQPMEAVLKVYKELLRDKYLPSVLEVFEGHVLSEAQLAAALSFHWNTGGIKRAVWVEKYKAGDIAGARKAFMNWRSPKNIIPRRRAERDLFFDGVWSGDGTVIEYTKVTNSGYPVWSSAKRIKLPDMTEPVPKPQTFWQWLKSLWTAK